MSRPPQRVRRAVEWPTEADVQGFLSPEGSLHGLKRAAETGNGLQHIGTVLRRMQPKELLAVREKIEAADLHREFPALFPKPTARVKPRR